MDQLRKAWSWLQRYHFWVLTVVVVVVALMCWWHGGNTLWVETKENLGKIDNQFRAAQAVKNQPFHANENVQAGQNEQVGQQQKSVAALWKQLYDRQTATVLKWPANLSEEFRSRIAKLNFGDKIPRNLRDHYNNYIHNHFPELPKIVGALEIEEGQIGMSFGRRGGFDMQNFLESLRDRRRVGPNVGTEDEFEEPEFLVVWADQQRIRDELAPKKRPSSKQIWKTQEDLWVYEALLHIIADTNKKKGADRFSNAAIRVIESLEVGKSAALASRGKGRIDLAEAALAAGGEMGPYGSSEGTGMSDFGGPYGEFSEYGEGGMGTGYGGMTTGAELSDIELFNNRYVDADGAPISDSGGGSMTAFGTEFKRLPIRMQLSMDQRWLPQLVAECASAPLQVEVQEIRINPGDEGSRSRGGRGYGRGGASSGYGAGSTGEEMTPESEPYMKTIVLQGTVYIFNPPTEQPTADASLATAAVR